MKGRQAAFEEAIQEAPVIAAVKNDMGLAHALRSECAAVFILYGTILDIGQIVKRIRAAGKLAFVHADLIEGLSNRGEIAVDFLAEATKADGIISTRPNLIHHAKELGLITVQRFFLLDSKCGAPEFPCGCDRHFAGGNAGCDPVPVSAGDAATDCQRAVDG
jgi:hypothetical protein